MNPWFTDGMLYSEEEANALIRRWWATFIGSTVERDGSVPGFRDHWSRMDEYAQKQADRFYHWCWRKVQRDKRDPDECIASSIAALREHLELFTPHDQMRPDTGEVAKLIAAIIKHVEDSPTPEINQRFISTSRIQVADETWSGWRK